MSQWDGCKRLSQGDDLTVRGDYIRAIVAYTEAIRLFPHAVVQGAVPLRSFSREEPGARLPIARKRF